MYKAWRFIYIYPNVPALSWLPIGLIGILFLALIWRHPYAWVLGIMFYLLSLLHLSTFYWFNPYSSWRPISDIFPNPMYSFWWVLEEVFPISIWNYIKNITYYLYSVMFFLCFSNGAFRFYRIDKHNILGALKRNKNNTFKDILDN